MNYRITHRTTYSYSAPVAVSHHAARLRPRDTETQRCKEFALSFDPEPDLFTEHQDSFGNQVSCFSIQKRHARFEVISRSLVTMSPVLQPDPAQTPPWEDVAALFRDPVPIDLLDPSGRVVRRSATGELSLTGLPRGLYVARSGGVSLRVGLAD